VAPGRESRRAVVQSAHHLLQPCGCGKGLAREREKEGSKVLLREADAQPHARICDPSLQGPITSVPAHQSDSAMDSLRRSSCIVNNERQDSTARSLSRGHASTFVRDLEHALRHFKVLIWAGYFTRKWLHNSLMMPRTPLHHLHKG
jgi:hypothetical protein